MIETSGEGELGKSVVEAHNDDDDDDDGDDDVSSATNRLPYIWIVAEVSFGTQIGQIYKDKPSNSQYQSPPDSNFS